MLSHRLQLHYNEDTGNGGVWVSPECRMGRAEARKAAEGKEQ